MGDEGEDDQCCVGMCPDCWKEGCGMDPCCGFVADGLEMINPFMEYCADCIWIMGSPLAFPIVFCFPPDPESDPPGGGWLVSMLKSPLVKPLHCCLYMVCLPCGQWWMRRKALGGDMTRYKLWQGYHDGPHCMARRCDGMPCTIEAGTYGEENCPEAFLCLEVCCLAGPYSPCCAFDVNRRLVKDERNLGTDPTENRVNACIGFFSMLAQACCLASCCACITALCIGCCAPDSEGAQECSGELGRASDACRSCASTCWRGIWSVKVIALGCMSAQMDHEIEQGQPLSQPPQIQPMERDDLNDENAWWKKPPPGR